MRKMSIVYRNGGDFPVVDPIFIVSTNCYHCGRQTRVAIDKDEDFDRTEAEHWEGRYKDLMGSVNTLLSEVERETGWNPHKEKFLRDLVEIRERLTKCP